jgi:metallo-beta-lactamase class B
MPADICVRPWEFFAEPFRIAGGLYYVGNRDVSSHLIDTGDGLVLFDTTYPQTVYLLLESVRRLGFDPADIRCIIHSHAHYDHFGGTRAIVELTGARTALGEQDVEVLTERPELSWGKEYGVEFRETFDVDIPLADGQKLEFGEVTFECVNIPGHTPGSISYFLHVEEEGSRLRVGAHGGPGLNTLTDEYLRENDLPFSRRDDYMDSLARLREEDVDIFIGIHPSQNDTLGKHSRMKDGENPFIDRTAWPAFLDGLEKRAGEAFGSA